MVIAVCVCPGPVHSKKKSIKKFILAKFRINAALHFYFEKQKRRLTFTHKKW